MHAIVHPNSIPVGLICRHSVHYKRICLEAKPWRPFVSMYLSAVADELGQHIHEQRKLQAQLQTSKSLKDHNVSTHIVCMICILNMAWTACSGKPEVMHCKL